MKPMNDTKTKLQQNYDPEGDELHEQIKNDPDGDELKEQLDQNKEKTSTHTRTPSPVKTKP